MEKIKKGVITIIKEAKTKEEKVMRSSTHRLPLNSRENKGNLKDDSTCQVNDPQTGEK